MPAIHCVKLAAAAAVFGVVGFVAPTRALDIHLNPGPLLAANPAALAAFERSAQAWESVISTPVRVNIDADLTDFSDPNVIGSTSLGTAPLNLDYTTVRNAMATRASRPGDSILASLPTTSQISANVLTNLGASFDKTTIGITRANQKALGLIANPASDRNVNGIIQFNSTFAFDFDSRDGVSSNLIDFQTAATHEMGHVLGFLSDTDDYDSLVSIDDNATTLDLFRFPANHKPVSASQFTTFARELRPGHAAVFSDTVSSYDMSTGAAMGDGRQASHWRDDFIYDYATGSLYIGPTIGIMDPTLDYGVSESISAADLRAFELIGWDTGVPEPTGCVLMSMLGVVLVMKRRRVAIAA